MSRPYELTKKWRLDEFEHARTRTKIGIYVTKEGTFYARVPETEMGELVTSPTKPELTKLIQACADRVLGLDWKPVIKVTLAGPRAGVWRTRRSGSSYGGKWDPDDPSTAGDEVQLSFIRYEIAVQPDKKRCERDWLDFDDIPDGAPDVFRVDRRYVDKREFTPTPGIEVELPYTEELWTALEDFRTRIVELNHQLRTLISREDVVPMLLAASRQKLLVMREPE